MSPSDSLHGTICRYGFRPTAWGFPPAEQGLSVPIVLFRHAPSLPTPESPSPARTRCFMDGDRLRHFRQAWPLSSSYHEAKSSSLTLRLASSPTQGFTPHGCPTACPQGYMANGSFHGDLLSDHKTTIVSLTHRNERNPSYPHRDTDNRLKTGRNGDKGQRPRTAKYSGGPDARIGQRQTNRVTDFDRR